MQTTAFAGGVVSAVDRFLNIAARLFQHLAHFARHVGRETFFVADQNFAQPKQNLGPARRGRATPAVERFLRGVNRIVDILSRWKGESGQSRPACRRD